MPEEDIGVDDHFFRLGGDSVRAMRLVTAARVKGLMVSVAMVFKIPRLAEMARNVELVGGGSSVRSGAELEEEEEGESPQPFELLSFA